MQHKFREAMGNQNILNNLQRLFLFKQNMHRRRFLDNTIENLNQYKWKSSNNCVLALFRSSVHPQHVSPHIPCARLFTELRFTHFALSWVEVNLSRRFRAVRHFLVSPQVFVLFEHFAADVTSVVCSMVLCCVIFQTALRPECLAADGAWKSFLLINFFFFKQVKFIGMNALLVPVKIFLHLEVMLAQLAC